jgi:hypothetical protein
MGLWASAFRVKSPAQAPISFVQFFVCFFNEANTLKSSLILIYAFQEQSINTQKDGIKP